jgi:hypothetical protein
MLEVQMKNEMRTVIIIFFILFLGCTEKNNQSANDYSNSLVILKNASNVRYNKLNGHDEVHYKLISKYPAKEIISELNNRLKAKGWTPLKKDWLNPEIPTSHVRGWTNYIDGTKNPKLEVHVWNCDWTNENEDILIFDLKYSYSVDKQSEMMDLTVMGIYIPTEIAKIRMVQINEYKKSIGEK